MPSKDKLTLISWIGGNDLKAVEGETLGPICATLKAVPFQSVELLYNYPEGQVKRYLGWLDKQVDTPIHAHSAPLSSPVNFGEIYQQASEHLSRLKEQSQNLAILLSPGTPAMQAVWILLGKTRFPCTYYQSSLEQGVQQVDIPFEVAAEYIPTAGGLSSEKLSQLAGTDAPVNAAFDHIITRNPRMLTLKSQAQILAQREVPVLIYGETGTGKELFARAIHNASSRANKPFVALNCGAIPLELVDSVLFGHKKGAFTGAIADKPGVFQQANGGTLFLDEFGELEPAVQVRLLRVLQEGVYVPVGGDKEHEVDIRLITATHRNLMEAVATGTFREDLFYRVAVGVLHLPPLREREGDISMLAETLLTSLGAQDAGLKDKKLSVEAKKVILRHSWRGNVRELQSSLLRAALWCRGDTVGADDIRQSLFQMPEKNTGLLDRDVTQGIDINEICDDVMRHYIPLALDAARGKKSKAAELLGMNSYQSLDHKMKKLNIT